MKKENKAKANRKALKQNLIETIEKTLNLNQEEKKAKKLKKVIRDAAKQITKKYLSKAKNRKVYQNQPDSSVTKRKNQRLSAQKKESQLSETINL